MAHASLQQKISFSTISVPSSLVFSGSGVHLGTCAEVDASENRSNILRSTETQHEGAACCAIAFLSLLLKLCSFGNIHQNASHMQALYFPGFSSYGRFLSCNE